MKWKRYQLIGMGAGALVFATVAWISFLLGTSTGLRVLSSGAEWAVDGLKVGDVSGSLLHLRLSDVRYEAPGIRFKADRFSYDVAGRAVFSNRIVVDDVRLTGAEVVVRTKELPPSADTPAEPSTPLTELRAPIPFFLQNLALEDISVDADGTLVTLRDFQVSGRWFERGVTIANAALTGVRVSTPEAKNETSNSAPEADKPAAQAEEPTPVVTVAVSDGKETVGAPVPENAASTSANETNAAAPEKADAPAAASPDTASDKTTPTPAEEPAQPLGERRCSRNLCCRPFPKCASRSISRSKTSRSPTSRRWAIALKPCMRKPPGRKTSSRSRAST